MNLRRLSVRSPLALLVVFAGMARSQGFYVESTHSTSPEKVEKTFYMPRMFKSVNGDGSNVTMLRFDRETFYDIHPEKKTYTAVTFAEMKAMVEKGRAKADEMMAKRLASLPPEQQAKMKKRMESMKSPGSPGAVRKVVATGEVKTISGYSCQQYLVKVDDKTEETIWATKQIGGFESAKKDLQEFMERMRSMIGTRGDFGAWYKDIDGFPIQTESHGSINTVTKVERRSIPASEFEVPAGYTKEKNRMMEGLESDKD